MEQDQTGKVTATLEDTTRYNMLLTKAILAEKDILAGEEAGTNQEAKEPNEIGTSLVAQIWILRLALELQRAQCKGAMLET